MADLTEQQTTELAAVVKAAGIGTPGLTDGLRARLAQLGIANHPDALAADEAAKAHADTRVAAIADAIANGGKGFTSAHGTELVALGRVDDPAIVNARADRLFALIDAGDLPYDRRARMEIAMLGLQADPRALELRRTVPVATREKTPAVFENGIQRAPAVMESVTRAQQEAEHETAMADKRALRAGRR